MIECGYVTLFFDGAYVGKSQDFPRQQEIPEVKESDLEGAVDFLESLPYVDANRIGRLGIYGSESYIPVAGVKEPRLKAITAIYCNVSNDNVLYARRGSNSCEKAYENGMGELLHLNFQPPIFEEGVHCYHSARSNRPG